MARNFKDAANTHFKQVQPVQKDAQVKTQHEAEASAVREKIVRLRSLRLAKKAAVTETV